jgi:hypothetical protein
MSFKDTKFIVKAVLVTQMSVEGQASLEESKSCLRWQAA